MSTILFPRAAAVPMRRISLRPTTNYHRLLAAHLSSSRDTRPGQAPPQKLKSGPSRLQNPSYPAFSFRGLGANRKLKDFVIVCLTIVGTLESVFLDQICVG